MKAHTIGFKNAVKELGRQLRAVITYGNVTLEEEIYAVTPHFEGGILKSIMKQLDLELSVDIPLETVLNCRIGILVNGSYEMLNYGNYVVYKSEKQEDTNTYKLTCYDKMLYSMKQNEELNIPYPISIKNYLIAICNKLGLTLKTTTFQNESRMIQNELYLGLDYTYRDILDEIAQATGSIICLNENDEVLVKYPTQTNDTIDEEFLKDVNVDFGQMYGAINTIVLSRSGESDNIYYPETLPENPIEIKIKNNQIMNWNDRSDYLPGIYNALNGLYYYINDFTSTGILYYDVGDLYNIQVGENTYQCLMLNDEINITTGIEEIIHTDLPEQSETDYTKADKTDRRINQTYLIVDKQNQQIESLITTQTDQNQKIARVTQTVEELNSKISDIADITTSLETNSARLEFEGINQSEPIRVVIHPIGVNISKLYPSTSLKPSTNLTIKTRILRFTNTTTEEVFDYELPDDLLYYDSENYDEFQLDYDGLTCIVNKKCKWNNDGTVGLLASERTDEYTFPHIELTDGNYIVQLIQYSNGYIFARLMAQNIYTTQFATKAELNSEISQTTQGINLSVDKKLSNYSTTSQMNSAIDLKANQITQTVSETYVTNQTLQDNYSTTQQTSGMISATVSSMTKNNLETVTVEYALGTDTETAPSSGWSTTAPPWQQGKYMWQRTKTKTADGTESISNPTCIAGATGASGVSISSITEYYAVSSSNSSAPADSAFKTTMQTMTSTNKYLWNYEVITYSNNNTQKTIKRVIGVYGDKGTNGTNGTNGIGISSIVNKYAVSSSNSTAPSSWSNTPQTMTATNKYLWNYEIITYSNNTTYTSTPAVIGTYGEKGNTGDTGKGVKAVVAQYYLSSSKTSQTGGSWSETQPAYKKDYYYWTRTKITWTDNTTTYTTPILVEEINSLNESVASLNIRAGNIESTVRTKVGNDEIISKINQSAEAVQIDADKISLNGKAINLTSGNITISSDKFSVDKNGNITATGGTIGGFGLSSDTFEAELKLNRDYTTEDSRRVQNIIVGNITPTQTDYEKYDFNNDEKISGIDLYLVTRFANNLESKKKKYVLDTLNATKAIQIFDETLGESSLNLGAFGSYINYLSTLSLEVKDGPSISQGGIEMPTTVGKIRIGNMILNKVDYSWLSLSNTNNGHSVYVSNDFIQFWTGNTLPTLVYSGVALYENNSGSTGTITLRDYAYNYDFLEIYFADHNNGNIKQMIKVENPDGKNAQMQILSQAGTDIRVNVQRATISGKTITKQYGQVNFMRGGDFTTNEIYIEKVIGYRSGYPDY